ncbi:hypothetical protein EDL98_10900 [Ornithobacterium rhinotracheale]|uniref:hypothetical protein n=1 Tax=Ornithobacterium rhinotracheale TaxID=28251 RepID=UPI00129C7DEA|nr:hypothetical protein [Ornithobacterium rhinotracheale]MRJ11572.1 hypothetical protein [Ornithobacterium rhinotracheale]
MNFIKEIKDNFDYVKKLDNDKKLAEFNLKFYLQKISPNFKLDENIDIDRLSIFKLIDIIIKQDIIFNLKSKSLIFRKMFNIYSYSQVASTNEVAKSLTLTRERVRQITSDLAENLHENLLFIKSLKIDKNNKQLKDFEYSILTDYSILDEINNKSNTLFTKNFLLLLISILKDDSYFLIGEIESVLLKRQRKDQNKYNLKNFYLINKTFLDQFNFYDFVTDVNFKLNEKIHKEYSLNFESYLYGFAKNKNIDFLKSLAPVCEHILIQEFSVFCDFDGNIIFERNQNKSIAEYAYEALENINRPAKVSEIKDKINEVYPTFEIDEDKVRCSLKRENGFVPIGRKSVFGLKKWEKEKDNFIGGTLKDVVYHYLLEAKTPKHVLEIIKVLQKYNRKVSSERSILTNLKSDPQKRFIIFNQNFCGLKDYDDVYDSKYNNLPSQLGKKIIGMRNKDFSFDEISDIIMRTYKLSSKETNLIIENFLNHMSDDK